MSAVDVLVVGAYLPALIGLRDYLGQALHGSVFGLTVSAKVCGVGMGVAGAWTAKRLVQLGPRAVVLVGTAPWSLNWLASPTTHSSSLWSRP